MLIFLLVASAFAAPALKNDAAARFEAAIGGAEALARHRDMLRSVLGDQYITEPRHTVSASSAATGRRLSENEINEPIAQYLYQGDIILTEADVARMTATRNKRGAPDVSTKRFNKNQPIGFIFDSSIPEASRKLIRETIGTVAAKTCLSFKENTGVTPQLWFHRGGGCSSVVGQQADPRYNNNHPISIDQGCERVGTITHEIFHSLGIHHTQTRKDRDSFINVRLDRIHPGKENNFKKLSDEANNNFGVPYEYGSVMHYPPTDFTIEYPKPVLELKYADYENTVAQGLFALCAHGSCVLRSGAAALPLLSLLAGGLLFLLSSLCLCPVLVCSSSARPIRAIANAQLVAAILCGITVVFVPLDMGDVDCALAELLRSSTCRVGWAYAVSSVCALLSMCCPVLGRLVAEDRGIAYALIPRKTDNEEYYL